MHLARESKCVSLREFLSRVTSRDLAEWEAFYTVEKEDADEAHKRMKLESKARQGVQTRKRGR